jgi:hypothetical protein
MAQDRNDQQDLMHYDALAQEALRGVIKAALRRAAEPGGMPGAHHFYITFKTRAPGVTAPDDLVERYPDEMTIVLQHQYWDLAPGETFFQVTLKFGGSPQPLSIPYAAVTRFYDPSVQFLLQFDGAAEAVAVEPPTAEVLPARARPAKNRAAEPAAEPGQESGSDEPKIVSLDQFRKK